MSEIANELRRLASCGDIPRYRRRQLTRLADMVSPDHAPFATASADVFADPYYRRPGLRMKALRSEQASPLNAAPIMLLTALQDQRHEQ